MIYIAYRHELNKKYDLRKRMKMKTYAITRPDQFVPGVVGTHGKQTRAYIYLNISLIPTCINGLKYG